MNFSYKNVQIYSSNIEKKEILILTIKLKNTMLAKTYKKVCVTLSISVCPCWTICHFQYFANCIWFQMWSNSVYKRSCYRLPYMYMVILFIEFGYMRMNFICMKLYTVSCNSNKIINQIKMRNYINVTYETIKHLITKRVLFTKQELLMIREHLMSSSLLMLFVLPNC